MSWLGNSLVLGVKQSSSAKRSALLKSPAVSWIIPEALFDW